MKKLSFSLIIIAVGTFAAVAAVPPPAAFLGPNDSDLLTVFDASGGLYKFTRAIEGVSLEGDTAPFIVDSNTGNGAFNGHYTVFGEIGDPNVWTDVVGVVATPGSPGNFEIVFFSDATSAGLDHTTIANFFSQGGTVAPVIDTALFETGNPQDVSQYVNASFTGFTAFFASDIPDGGMTVALLGMALGAIEVLRRKLKAA
jgi:hypothetical protein